MLWSAVAARYAERPQTFCDLRSTTKLTMAADFSGDHKASPYHTVAFVLMDEAALPKWKERLVQVRNRGLGRRRMSFKRLNDGVRWQLLPSYLGTFQGLAGYCIVVAFNKRLVPLVEDVASHTGVLAALAAWPTATRMRALHIAVVGALAVASVCAAGSDLVLVLDEDAVAANKKRLDEFVTLLRRSVADLAARQYGTITYRTTAIPDQNLFVEDICAIPDLAAGAVTDLLRHCSAPRWSEDLSVASDQLNERSRVLLDWFLGEAPGLTRLAAVVDPADQPNIGVARLLR